MYDVMLSLLQVEEVQNIEAGNISPEKAEKRADLGANWNDPAQIQAFDGPAPETINGRLSMLAVVIALGYEWFTGLGIREQVGDHPVIVLAVFVLISLASFIPITRLAAKRLHFDCYYMCFMQHKVCCTRCMHPLKRRQAL